MHKTHYVCGTSVDKLCYKMYCNVLTKVKTLAKKLYYHHKLDQFSDNPKKTWEILRTLLPTKSNSAGKPNSITINNTSITHPSDIAEEFNNYFASIGKSLATGLNDNHPDECDNFLKYLKNPCLSSIYLQPTTPQEITAIINSLKQNKASGHDDFLPYFINCRYQDILYL